MYGVNPRMLIRIYFCWDEFAKRIIIGHMPEHLATLKQNTKTLCKERCGITASLLIVFYGSGRYIVYHLSIYLVVLCSMNKDLMGFSTKNPYA